MIKLDTGDNLKRAESEEKKVKETQVKQTQHQYDSRVRPVSAAAGPSPSG